MHTCSDQVEIIGVPSDLGANTRGANMGPSSLRNSMLHAHIKKLGKAVIDSGNLEVPLREHLSEKELNSNCLATIAELCAQLHHKALKAAENNHTVLTIGGDHSIAVGSISGVNKHFVNKNEELGLIWIDAHADMNTPQISPSGNIHGMPLATLLGHGHDDLLKILEHKPLNPKNIALLGIRDIDKQERDFCTQSGIAFYTMKEIDSRGMFSVATEAINRVCEHSTAIHVSLDLDGIDPLYAPGVSTPVNGGISYREVHLLLELIADTRRLASADLVELNPMNDTDNKTARLGVELLESLLGKAII